MSGTGGGSLRRCQCASCPSPRQETMPTPVIQVSRVKVSRVKASCGVSAMAQRLHRKRDGGGNLLHAGPTCGGRKRDDPEGDLRVAHALTFHLDLCFGHGEAGALVQQLRARDQRLPRRHERAQLRLLEGRQKRHARESGEANDHPARRLRHGFEQQHARHQRVAGEVAFENGRLRGNNRLRLDGSPDRVEFQDAVDKAEVLKVHADLGGHAARLAATSSSMRVHRFCNTKYCSVVALPSFTSWVHCSSGILIPKVLSMANAMSRKSRLSIPRSLMAWLSGLMVSRGMSHVSVMMLTTVSNVDAID